VGLGEILDQIGPSTFVVDVPGLKIIHPVFHASLLEPYVKKGTIEHLDQLIMDTLREFGDDVYEVDHIVKRRKTKSS
jgi:hypothetical protein